MEENLDELSRRSQHNDMLRNSNGKKIELDKWPVVLEDITDIFGKAGATRQAKIN